MSNKSEHTPGPWFAGWPLEAEKGTEMDIVAAGRGGVATVYLNKSGDADNMEAVKANARLIAAAPELLAALKACLEDGVSKTAAPDGLGWSAIEQARAAIAKAKEN